MNDDNIPVEYKSHFDLDDDDRPEKEEPDDFSGGSLGNDDR